MKHLKTISEAETATTLVDRLSDALALVCIKEIGSLDLKVLKAKTRQAVVEELIEHTLQQNSKFGQEQRILYKRNKNQLVKQVLKDIIS